LQSLKAFRYFFKAGIAIIPFQKKNKTKLKFLTGKKIQSSERKKERKKEYPCGTVS